MTGTEKANVQKRIITELDNNRPIQGIKIFRDVYQVPLVAAKAAIDIAQAIRECQKTPAAIMELIMQQECQIESLNSRKNALHDVIKYKETLHKKHQTETREFWIDKDNERWKEITALYQIEKDHDETIRRMSQRIDDLGRKLASKEKNVDYEEAKNEIDDLENDKENLEYTISDLESDVDNLKNDLDQGGREYDDLQAECDNLKIKLEEREEIEDKAQDILNQIHDLTEEL